MTLLLILLAVLPTIFMIVFIYYKDSYEKEPVGLLVSLFALGMAGIIPAVAYEAAGEAFIGLFFYKDSWIYNFISAFFGVALVEEGVKFIVLYFRTWKNPNYNYKFDGIVYAVLVSLGFATVENILYVLEGGLSVAIARALLSVPSHAIDAVYMGFYYGYAKYYDSVGIVRRRNKNLRMAVIVPVLLHGCYDFLLFENSLIYLAVFLVFVIVLDVLAVIRINRSSKKNMQIYKSAVQVYCTNCGQKLNEYGFYCMNCGCPVRRM